jgi:hypothetical protein
MPALPSDSTKNHCDMLNKSQFPTLWFDTTVEDAVAIPAIVRKGRLVKFSTVIQSLSAQQLSLNVLGSIPSSATPYALIQFLAGQGAPNEGAASYTQMKSVLLSLRGATGGAGSSGTSYQSIVDNYFVGTGGLTSRKYTFSSPGAPLIRPTMFWTPTDANKVGGTGQPVSILGNLINNGLLLSHKELYNPKDFDPTLDIPPANTESLMYLMSLQDAGASLTSSTKAGVTTTTITQSQRQRKYTLEARNLRFFGAWLIEYCFYRSRYEWLLKKYFSIYTASPYTPVNLATDKTMAMLFSGMKEQNPAPNQYSSTNVSQAELLRCMVFHLACLNTRMTDMRILLGNISEYYGSVQADIQAAINSKEMTGSNTDLTSKLTMLNDSAAKMKNYLTEKDFREGVMQYNLEKNRYANILLGLYAFLNIAAVAMIVQIRNT